MFKGLSIIVSSIVISSNLMAAMPVKDVVEDKNSIIEKQENIFEIFNKLKISKEELMESISSTSILKSDSMIVEEVYNLNDIYFVKGVFKGPQGSQPYEVFVTLNGKVINSNQMFTEDGMPFFLPVDMSQYDKAVSFTLGEATVPEKTLYVFTDIDCPYCMKFTEKYEDVLNKGFQLKIMLFPLEQLHPDAKAKSMYVLSMSDDKKLETLKNVEGKNPVDNNWKNFKPTPEIETKIKQARDVAMELKVQGTPTVLDAYGKKVNWTML